MKRNLFLILILVISILKITTEEKIDTKDILNKYKDTLLYGIDDEIIKILAELGNNPKTDFYPLLIQRYKELTLPETKIAFINFFSDCENLPDEIVNLLYEEAKNDPENIKLNSTLLSFLGKKGKLREGLLLIDRLKSSNSLIKITASDSLSNIKDQEIIKPLLDRLKIADESDDMFLDQDIKSRLIIALGKLKAKDASDYLKKILTDSLDEKFVIMYTMTSLAQIEDKSAIPLIKKNLGSDDVKIREYAGYSLSLYKDPSVVPILQNMLKNNREKIRIYACQGLVLNNDTSSIKILSYKFMNDPSNLVRKEAIASLLYFGLPGINAIKEEMKDKEYPSSLIYYISDAVCKKPDNSNVDFLLTLYEKADKNNKEIIAKSIVNGNSNLLDPIISKLLDNENYLIRLGALKAVYNTKNSTLWAKVKIISENDKIDAVKNAAKKYLALKGN
jgi:HEAT repeat protein